MTILEDKDVAVIRDNSVEMYVNGIMSVYLHHEPSEHGNMIEARERQRIARGTVFRRLPPPNAFAALIARVALCATRLANCIRHHPSASSGLLLASAP